MKIVAIILARGGSKGISNKNIIDFCGKPLLVWTIEHCFAGGIELVYVSSDSKEILNTGEKYGAKTINRPKDISGDAASSESGWLHALDIIENKIGNIDWVFAPQVTSPLRSKDDIYNAKNEINQLLSDDWKFTAYYLGDDVALRLLLSSEITDKIKNRLKLILEFKKPEFPVCGNDLIKLGFRQGVDLGKVLKKLEIKWVKSNFLIDKDQLLTEINN